MLKKANSPGFRDHKVWATEDYTGPGILFDAVQEYRKSQCPKDRLTILRKGTKM